MAAFSENFPWANCYGNYNFFEQRMHEHTKVKSSVAIDSGLYNIQLIDGRNLRIFICECYSFGTAEYIESCQNYGTLDAVIISSLWCGYTMDVKHYCRGKKVGIYTISGFMAAINKNDFWAYLTSSERDYFEKNGWL